MAREDFKGPLQNVSRDEIRRNADYQGHPCGVLSEEEIAAMHLQVEAALCTTNGDTGPCTITARQLALLLAAAVDQTDAPGKKPHGEPLRSKVKIEVSPTTEPHLEDVGVWLNGALHGSYVVDKRHTPIDEALLILGVENIIYDGDGPEFHHTRESLNERITWHAQPPCLLGDVRFHTVWVEGAEEYIINIYLNGKKRSGTSPKLNYRSLRAALEALQFDVEMVGVD